MSFIDRGEDGKKRERMDKRENEGEKEERMENMEKVGVEKQTELLTGAWGCR